MEKGLEGDILSHTHYNSWNGPHFLIAFLPLLQMLRSGTWSRRLPMGHCSPGQVTSPRSAISSCPTIQIPPLLGISIHI